MVTDFILFILLEIWCLQYIVPLSFSCRTSSQSCWVWNYETVEPIALRAWRQFFSLSSPYPLHAVSNNCNENDFIFYFNFWKMSDILDTFKKGVITTKTSTRPSLCRNQIGKGFGLLNYISWEGWQFSQSNAYNWKIS